MLYWTVIVSAAYKSVALINYEFFHWGERAYNDCGKL